MMGHAVQYAYLSASTGASSTFQSGTDHTKLVAINIGTGAASAVVTVYDGVDNTGAVVATIDASSKGSFWFGGIRLHLGLFVAQTGGAGKVTICYE